MTGLAVNEAQASAVQNAARPNKGRREGTRARPANSVDWANFIEILIGVVSTDLIIGGAM
jgi:hypothetical protein